MKKDNDYAAGEADLRAYDPELEDYVAPEDLVPDEDVPCGCSQMDASEAFFAPCYRGDDSPGEHNREVGRCGERAAALYLERQGYFILERNWRCSAGEADLIALDGDCLVLCEVKTRMDVECGLPEEAVDAKKRSRYECIATAFLKGWNGGDTQVRFDVISVLVLAEDRAFIRHHINAWGVGA